MENGLRRNGVLECLSCFCPPFFFPLISLISLYLLQIISIISPISFYSSSIPLVLSSHEDHVTSWVEGAGKETVGWMDGGMEERGWNWQVLKCLCMVFFSPLEEEARRPTVVGPSINA